MRINEYTPSGGDGSSLPDQAGNSGKFLTTDGANASWAVIGGASYPAVANYAALPAASGVGSSTYLVLNPQGVWFINYKYAGLYYSDGANWNYLGAVPENLFVDNVATFSDNADSTKKMVFELKNTI